MNMKVNCSWVGVRGLVNGSAGNIGLTGVNAKNSADLPWQGSLDFFGYSSSFFY